MPTDAQEEPIAFEISRLERLTLPPAAVLIVGRLSDDPRDPRPDVDLNAFDAYSLGVSRRHVKIVRRGELAYAIDLGSTNGTFVNGLRLIAHSEHVLQSGDELQLGRLRIVVRLPPYPSPSAAPPPPPSPRPLSPAPVPIFPPQPPKRLIAHAEPEYDDEE